jgi:nucleoside-diphosphate-sugar epimerase
LTGATGFTGSAIARRLLAEGYRVRALVRRAEARRQMHSQIETVMGSLSDRPVLRRLVADAELVVHVASMYRTEGPRERFLEVNHGGTVHLLEAASAAGVRRFVYCSTIGVHGDVATTPANEDSPCRPRDHYQESKLLAEQACRKFMAIGRMEVVILRPCAIYGPGDTRMLKMFRMLSRGVFVMIGEGQANFHAVYIDDLVEGFMKALTVPEAAGETFIIGGARYLPLAEYVALAAQALGTVPPKLQLPYWLMAVAAFGCETLCRPFGLNPPLHRRRLRFFKHNRAFSIEKARHVLHYQPRVDLEEGFRRTVESYRSQRLLPLITRQSRSA